MPDVRDESTVEAIAQAFTGKCKRNKEKAMQAAGYSESYARSGEGHDTYANPRLIDAIKRIDDRTAAKLDFSREGQLKKAEDARLRAITANQVSAEISAIRAQNSQLGYDQEKAPNEEAEAQRRQRMSDEDARVAEFVADQRVQEMCGGLKAVGPKTA